MRGWVLRVCRCRYRLLYPELPKGLREVVYTVVHRSPSLHPGVPWSCDMNRALPFREKIFVLLREVQVLLGRVFSGVEVCAYGAELPKALLSFDLPIDSFGGPKHWWMKLYCTVCASGTTHCTV